MKSIKDGELKEKEEEKKKIEQEIEPIKWVTGDFVDTETFREEFEVIAITGSPSAFAEGQPIARLSDSNNASMYEDIYDMEGNFLGKQPTRESQGYWDEASEDSFAF